MSSPRAETTRLVHEDGSRAVELARDSVREFVVNGRRENPGSMRDAFYARSGAFVRLETPAPRSQLRGCAGAYDSPKKLLTGDEHLGTAIVEAAIEAASKDSRSEITAPELDNLNVSVFVVDGVETVAEPTEDIEVGKHGVGIEGRGNAGWMFPTVPVENDWKVFEYLDRTCRKAGLPPDAWMDDDVDVYRLSGQVFAERDPGGSVSQLLD